MNSGTKKTTRKEEKQSSGLSQASMKAMISADSAIKQAKVQSSVGIKLEGRAGTSGYGNVVIAPNILEQMANNPEKASTTKDVILELNKLVGELVGQK